MFIPRTWGWEIILISGNNKYALLSISADIELTASAKCSDASRGCVTVEATLRASVVARRPYQEASLR